MDVDLIFKIAAVGILVAVLNQLLVRSGREEQAMMTTLAGLVVVMHKGDAHRLIEGRQQRPGDTALLCQPFQKPQ